MGDRVEWKASWELESRHLFSIESFSSATVAGGRLVASPLEKVEFGPRAPCFERSLIFKCLFQGSPRCGH